MYEHISVVGERGQITIPKIIREKEGIKEKDEVIVKIEGGRIIVEKSLNKKEKEALMKEFYVKYARLNEEIAEEWKYASIEADRSLDEPKAW